MKTKVDPTFDSLYQRPIQTLLTQQHVGQQVVWARIAPLDLITRDHRSVRPFRFARLPLFQFLHPASSSSTPSSARLRHLSLQKHPCDTGVPLAFSFAFSGSQACATLKSSNSVNTHIRPTRPQKQSNLRNRIPFSYQTHYLKRSSGLH